MTGNDNYIEIRVPRDQYYSNNTGTKFTLRQLKQAARDELQRVDEGRIPRVRITKVATELGLTSSGHVTNFLRHKMVQYSVTGADAFRADFSSYKPEKYGTQDYRRVRGLKTAPLPNPIVKVKAEEIRTWKRTSVDESKLERAAELILEAVGEDPDRDGLKDTPKRYAKYMADIMNGHYLKSEDHVTDFDNDSSYTGPVVVTNMPFYTVCEHHLAPFIGTWDFAYQPKDRILGLSKVVRIARVYMKRPQVQERLTQQIAEKMYELLQPQWVIVRMGAEHFCMSTRGVRTPGAKTYTRAVRGIGETDYILTIPEGE